MLKTVGNPSTRYGDQTIIDGNLVIGTAGKGIDFSANPAASGVTSELLDDYEEGTWTPTLTTTGTNFTSVTYNAGNTATYVKIGDLVFVQAQFSTDAVTIGSATGDLLVGGFPFAAASVAAIPIGTVSGFVTQQPFNIQMRGGSLTNARVQFRSASNGATTSMSPANVNASAGNSMQFSGCYRAA
jgi:hypothetical protein